MEPRHASVLPLHHACASGSAKCPNYAQEIDVVLRISDEVVPSLNSEPTLLGRQALESLALDLLAQDKISEHELGLMLGIDNRFDVDAFLKSKNAPPSYTLENLIRDRQLARNLFPENA